MRTFRVAEMNDLHHEISRRLVLNERPKKIAKELECSYQTVINVKNSPVVQEQMAIMRGAIDAETVDIGRQIRNFLPECVKILKEITEDADADPKLRSRNCLSLLAIEGYSPQKSVNIKGSHLHLTGTELQKIKERGVQLGLASGTVIEGEIVGESESC
jgi:hypothetical protein